MQIEGNASGQQTRCHRCGRSLRAVRSVAAGYGPGCRARIRAAALTAAVADFTAQQVAKALELIADKGIVRTGMAGVWRTVSSDGQSYYLSAATACNCAAGARWRRCYHVLAVLLLQGRAV